MRRMRCGLFGVIVTLGASSVAVPAATIAAGGPVVMHAPRTLAGPAVQQLGWTSGNWSGYAKAGSFGGATGRWRVPSVSRSSASTYSSAWVGIDGFNNQSLIQTGTESDWSGGAARYGVWWEILPAPATFISTISIHPGDSMSADIHRVSGSNWSISITDVSTGQSFTTQQSYSGQGSSVEWILEAPSVGGRQANVANYSLTAFDPGTANGAAPGLVSSDGGAMVQHGRQVSTPSNPDTDADGFSAKHGASAPPPPGS